MPTIEEVLEDELSEAVNNLTLVEGEDDQDKLREMILGLQIQAFRRGVDMANESNNTEITVGFEAEEATNLVSELLRNGSATIRFMVNTG